MKMTVLHYLFLAFHITIFYFVQNTPPLPSTQKRHWFQTTPQEHRFA